MKKNNKKQTKLNGFTLIELLITITISSVLLVSSIPYFTDLINQFKIDNLIEELSSDINKSRILAISSNSTVYFSFSYDDGFPSWQLKDDTGTIKTSKSTINNIYLNFSNTDFSFSTYGFLQNSSSENLTSLDITICDTTGENGVKINLNAFGKQNKEVASCS